MPLFFKDHNLLPKKRDYRAVLNILNEKYGKDRRTYKSTAFDASDFNQRISQKYAEFYGDEQATANHFAEFWDYALDWMKSDVDKSNPNDFVSVYNARNIILICMDYEFDKPSNIEYF